MYVIWKLTCSRRLTAHILHMACGMPMKLLDWVVQSMETVYLQTMTSFVRSMSLMPSSGTRSILHIL
ncbi:hypothetical protein MT325_m126L [Paramecium bursaria chlorella virus MT325]|uniref:Uncharacterized protein m126L n=1 Tax=Paramecium bursaria Chlorella virus MT325 TaxID=346932 RepID=A7ITK6_PBCVM|nr:hypothetical protein MT325_m126L [Paramecium bursaria chlorella virus MT325]